MRLANAWPVVSLGEVVETTQYGTADRASDRAVGVPILRMNNISYSGAIDLSELKYIDLPAGDAERYRVRRGDLLFNRTNSRELVGKMAMWDRDDPFAFAGYLVRVRLKREHAEPRFVSAWFNTLEMKQLLRTRAKPSINMANISASEVLRFPLVLPPLDEQRRIAEVLDRAEALRAKRRAALALLDTLTQSIFLDMFGDPLRNARGWETVELQQVGTLDRGVSKHRPRNAVELLGGPYPLVQTGDVANSEGYIRTCTGSYSDAGLRQSKLWPAGTLCITIAANIARAGILTFDACFPDSVVGFVADGATVEFVRVWLSFLQKTLEDSAPEVAQKNINLAILRSLRVPLPPAAERQGFAGRVAAVEKLKSAHRASLAKLDELFASLQHRAFRGEL